MLKESSECFESCGSHDPEVDQSFFLAKDTTRPRKRPSRATRVPFVEAFKRPPASIFLAPQKKKYRMAASLVFSPSLPARSPSLAPVLHRIPRHVPSSLPFESPCKKSSRIGAFVVSFALAESDSPKSLDGDGDGDGDEDALLPLLQDLAVSSILPYLSLSFSLIFSSLLRLMLGLASLFVAAASRIA